MTRYRWQPASPGQIRGIEPGGIVEVPPCPQHVIDWHIANVPGEGGQPCLIEILAVAEIVSDPAPPVAHRRRKPRAEG